MLKGAVVQNAIDELMVKQQDLDTVRIIFLQEMKSKNPNLSDKEKSIRVRFERPDRDAVGSCPVIDNGDGTYSCLATVQVTLSFEE